MPLIRSYPEAGSLNATDAFVIDREGVGTMFIEGQFLGGSGDRVLTTFQGVGSPGDGAWLGTEPFPVTVLYPADWGGLFGWVLPDSLPDDDAVFTIFKASASDPAGTQVGTVTIASDGSVTGDTSATAVTFEADTAMVVYCPDPADATLADFAISFLGSAQS